MLSDDLVRWAAEARVDEAGRARARQRWLRRQAEEEATFGGLLVDLAERDKPVVVRTASGRRHRGRVAAVGTDFVLLGGETRHWVLVPLEAITTVRPVGAGGGAAAGHRAPALDLLLGEALDAMAGDLARVAVTAVGDPDPVAGDLEAVGDDVLTVRLDGGAAGRAYIRLGAIAEIAVDA